MTEIGHTADEKGVGRARFRTRTSHELEAREPAVHGDSDAVYRAMRRRITCWAAASEIARPGFPSGELPRVAPIPYANLGHTALFDYNLFASAVWVTALALRDSISATRRKARLWNSVLGPVAVLAVILSAVTSKTELWAISSFLVTIVVAVKLRRDRDLNRSARRIRKAAIVKLMRSETDGLVNHAELDGAWIGWASGHLGESIVPTLVAGRGLPFPGFGRVQLDEVFVTSAGESQPIVDEAELRGIVDAAVVVATANSGFDHVFAGKVVVVDGSTLEAASPWLSGNGTPSLWIDERDVASVATIDPAASVRTYLAVQILFPDHNTTATLFLRAFKVGSAAAVIIHIATLGPPPDDALLIMQRSLCLSTANRISWLANMLCAKPKSNLGGLLYECNRLLDSSSDYISAYRIDPDALAPFNSKEQQEIAAEAEDLKGRLAHWIGDWAELAGWRENHSRTLTSDYFGVTEMRAALRTLYETVATKVLDTLQQHGFDISSYRDKEGRWQIHADKIDSLIIGEKIDVNTAGAKRTKETSKEANQDVSPTPPKAT